MSAALHPRGYTPTRPRPFPWLREERLDDTRILRRCSELEGGCGEQEEVMREGKRFPGFVAWYREHNRRGGPYGDGHAD